MSEEWKTCVDFPDYAVSSLGRVKRVRAGATVGYAGRILKISTPRKGSAYVSLQKGGISHRPNVHRLMGVAFHDLKKEEHTPAQLRWKSRGNSNVTSRFKGVWWHAKGKKWRASIQLDGRTKHLGGFALESDAARAYDAAAYQAWGEFAFLNFPDEAAFQQRAAE
jgi:NUMOD4 motif/AP2 domain